MPAVLDVEFAQPEGFRPLSLDLRRPEASGAPLVVFLHGGGFLRGSRRVFTPGITAEDSFDRIVTAGFAVASCEYRLSGEANFPAQLDDVDAAIEWLHAHADDLGIDARQPVMWGVSAGATLAALTGLRRDDVAGVVDWFGPADLFAMAGHDTGEAAAETREARWLGATAAQQPARARAASPALQVHAAAPPFHIAHGANDRHVPVQQSELLHAALVSAGASSSFERIPAAEHFWKGVTDTGPLFDSAIDFVRRVTRPTRKD